MISWIAIKGIYLLVFSITAIIIFWIIAFFLFWYSRYLTGRYVDKDSSAGNIQFVHWSYIQQLQKLAWANWGAGVLILLVLVIESIICFPEVLKLV